MALEILQTASIAGLTFSCWEILITLQDEVEIIWPRRTTIVKGLYFFTRYFALVIQICNIFIAKILRVRYPVKREICRLWLSYQALSVFFMLGALDLILMARVYAFYNRKRWIAILIMFLLFVRVGLSSASAVATLPDQTFDNSCLNDYIPTMVMYFFIVGEFLLQGTILALTMAKHIMAVRAGWARTPLVSLLCRDGATTFTIIVGVLIGTIIYARCEFTHDSAHAVFPTFVAVLSCLGCRLIVNMMKLVVDSTSTAVAGTQNRSPEILEFTTIIESIWSQTASDARVSSTVSIL
ncbi:hypothetical protein CPC08DRAFT_658948 [Agrocybe pediades]|nr:hypothetical protein CPC08DRAFT_658948 [Agrocybe pediades]